jgi:hypothetical protein
VAVENRQRRGNEDARYITAAVVGAILGGGFMAWVAMSLTPPMSFLISVVMVIAGIFFGTLVAVLVANIGQDK